MLFHLQAISPQADSNIILQSLYREHNYSFSMTAVQKRTRSFVSLNKGKSNEDIDPATFLQRLCNPLNSETSEVPENNPSRKSHRSVCMNRSYHTHTGRAEIKCNTTSADSSLFACIYRRDTRAGPSEHHSHPTCGAYKNLNPFQ